MGGENVAESAKLDTSAYRVWKEPRAYQLGESTGALLYIALWVETVIRPVIWGAPKGRPRESE